MVRFKIYFAIFLNVDRERCFDNSPLVVIEEILIPQKAPEETEEAFEEFRLR